MFTLTDELRDLPVSEHTSYYYGCQRRLIRDIADYCFGSEEAAISIPNMLDASESDKKSLGKCLGAISLVSPVLLLAKAQHSIPAMQLVGSLGSLEKMDWFIQQRFRATGETKLGTILERGNNQLQETFGVHTLLSRDLYGLSEAMLQGKNEVKQLVNLLTKGNQYIEAISIEMNIDETELSVLATVRTTEIRLFNPLTPGSVTPFGKAEMRMKITLPVHRGGYMMEPSTCNTRCTFIDTVFTGKIPTVLGCTRMSTARRSA